MVNAIDVSVTILGCGVMGKAILSSLLTNRKENSFGNIYCCTNSSKSLDKLVKEYKDEIIPCRKDHCKTAIKKSKIIVLGLKPHDLEGVLDLYRDDITENHIVVSLAAGYTIGQLKALCSSKHIYRLMTNTAATIGAGVGILSSAHTDKKTDGDSRVENCLLELFGGIGPILLLPENLMDASSSLVGCSPAFCLLVLNSIAESALAFGIPYSTAIEVAAKAMEGAAKLVLQTGEHSETLKNNICTPGGATIAGLMVLEKGNMRGLLIEAMERSTKKCSELSS